MNVLIRPVWLLLAIAGLIFFGRFGLLVVVLLLACYTDLAARRIPNLLSFGGLLAGLGCQILLPEGAGFVSALQGVGLGFALFLPLYLLRAMGAGDVKLMAMVGAFVGVEQIIGVVLSTLIVGGILSVLVVLRRGAVMQLLNNLRLMLFEAGAKVAGGKLPVVEQPVASVGKLPYAVVIALGALGYLLFQRLGWVRG